MNSRERMLAAINHLPVENIIAMYDEAWKYGKRA
jgi:hypothetical protein